MFSETNKKKKIINTNSKFYGAKKKKEKMFAYKFPGPECKIRHKCMPIEKLT